jgi:hypothetical protein
MSDRDMLLTIAEWHQLRASENLALARQARRRKKAYLNYIALIDKHSAFASRLRHLAERQPERLSFRELMREERVICGCPVPGPTFTICNRIRGHDGSHRSVKQ